MAGVSPVFDFTLRSRPQIGQFLVFAGRPELC
jgi:hypothetical protein